MGELVLVTGGARTLGRAVVEPLLERGHAVRSVDIRPIDGLPADVETAIVDLRPWRRSCGRPSRARGSSGTRSDPSRTAPCPRSPGPVSYTHLRAHETRHD